MDNSVGIIIADYSQFQLRAMENLICQTNGLHLMYATTNGDDLLQKLPQYNPGVIITELELQGTSGLVICRVAQKQYPHIGKMIFTMHDKCYMAKQALKAGVLGFLKKDTTEEEIIRCIQDVSLGHLHICPPYSELGKKVLMEEEEPNEFQLLVLNLLVYWLYYQPNFRNNSQKPGQRNTGTSKAIRNFGHQQRGGTGRVGRSKWIYMEEGMDGRLESRGGCLTIERMWSLP